MKKQVMFVLLLSILLVTSFVIAQDAEDSQDSVEEKAIQCIKEEIGSDCSAKLNTQSQAFALLSVGDYENCYEDFLADSNNGECWPAGNCKIKDTSIALLALDRIGKDTTKISDWLLNQTKVASSLIWYIEVDADEETSCSVSYDTFSSDFTINEDKTISGLSDTCFSLSPGNYWLQISSNCLEKDYTISCDKDFKSTLLYQTQSSSTIHVSQTLHTATANSFTEEKVTFECFAQGTACDFEGSLWATFALSKQINSVNKYLPYLKAFAPENKGDFPEAFLYALTGGQEYLTSTIKDNFKGNFWQVGTKNKEYNTAIAFLALGSSAVPEVEKAKEYLVNTQGENGCWNNARDTGFLLYTGWQITPDRSTPTPDPDNPDNPVPSPLLNCEVNNNFCVPSFDCGFGNKLSSNDFYCSNSLDVCCSQLPEQKLCSELLGRTCDAGFECPNGNYYAEASDVPFGECCQVACTLIQNPDIETNACEDSGRNCQSSCSDSQEEVSSLSCGTSLGICCQDKEEPKNSFWLWFFIIAIVVVIILILLRNKIRLLLFRAKSKFKKKPETKSRSIALPPRTHSPPPSFRPTHRPPLRRPLPPNKPTTQDKDFEDTLKKLREMSG